VLDAEPHAALQIPGTTLLIVDDDSSFRRALRRLLELERISVVEADDGEGAIHVIEQDEPQVLDAVVTDVAMQRVFGPELIAVIREHRPSLPVVAMTGWDPIPPGFPAVPLLIKPFELEQLIEVVGPLVLTPKAVRRRVRQMRADAAESRALAKRQREIGREHLAKAGELMKAFRQLRERMKLR
jgi:two-component system, NtrC family, C4-dicarboxylate transport response regulator DctD